MRTIQDRVGLLRTQDFCISNSIPGDDYSDPQADIKKKGFPAENIMISQK